MSVVVTEVLYVDLIIVSILLYYNFYFLQLGALKTLMSAGTKSNLVWGRDVPCARNSACL